MDNEIQNVLDRILRTRKNLVGRRMNLKLSMESLKQGLTFKYRLHVSLKR